MKGNTKAILEFKGVSMNYHTPQGETLAVEDLSFSVYDGEFIAIIGPSGCGKTTVCNKQRPLLCIYISFGKSFKSVERRNFNTRQKSRQKQQKLRIYVAKRSTFPVANY